MTLHSFIDAAKVYAQSNEPKPKAKDSAKVKLGLRSNRNTWPRRFSTLKGKPAAKRRLVASNAFFLFPSVLQDFLRIQISGQSAI